jgi:hypothetical protein
MYGYKYSLIGEAVFSAVGLVLALFFLPYVRPNNSVKPPIIELEEGGIAVVIPTSVEKGTKDETDTDSATEVGVNVSGVDQSQQQKVDQIQKQEIEEIPGKTEILDEKEEIRAL